MAYILGFFAADGYMVKNKRGAHFVEFYITDADILRRIRRALNSNHSLSRIEPRSINHKPSFRLQIGSREMFHDLVALGFTQKKSKTLKLPTIPERYVSHYIRGYFDGDGNVYFRKHWVAARNKKKWIFTTRFTCGCKTYLEDLLQLLHTCGLKKGFILSKYGGSGFELVFSHLDSLALYRLVYNTAHDTDFYLPRKYKLFRRAIRTLYPTMRV